MSEKENVFIDKRKVGKHVFLELGQHEETDEKSLSKGLFKKRDLCYSIEEAEAVFL